MNLATESIDPARFDVRNIPCRVKHAQIFQCWSELPVGGHFVLVNDHDPVPLYHQFVAQFPGAFNWEYLVTGPEEFQIQITRLAASPVAAAVPRQTCGSKGPSNVFDVRPISPRVKHSQIFQRWLDLPVGGSFVLLNDHDPVPLRYQFDAQFPRAFSWEYLDAAPGEFRVLITKLAPTATPVVPPAPQRPSVSKECCGGSKKIAWQVDARGLEPPEPLVRILNALETLPAGCQLRALTDREPCHLFGEAEQRGFNHHCTEQPDGSWITILDRA